MLFPRLDEATRSALLAPPDGRVRLVLDTDTYNEIDDQFALTYAALSPERIDLEAVSAAPFHNARSSGPEDGMNKSHDEILRVLDRLGGKRPDVLKGSREWLSDESTPVESEAARDLIKRARTGDGPLYVVAIGAITNVASALLMEPLITERLVVVWLGGHALHWPRTDEFNLRQDVRAARVVLNSGVPLVHVPCAGVASHLAATVPEMRVHVRGRGAIGDYLLEIFEEACSSEPGASRVIWDMAAVAWLLEPEWVPTEIVPSPVVTDELTWDAAVPEARHFIRSATFVRRDAQDEPLDESDLRQPPHPSPIPSRAPRLRPA